MKQIARYKINFDSKWMTVSGVLMGVCFFMQSVYFLGVVKLQGLDFPMLLLHLIVPMALEFLWLVLLRGMKLNAAGVFGLLGTWMLILFMLQAWVYGDTWDLVSTALYVLFGGAALIFITGGFFPYKLIGMAVMTIILCIRFFVFDWPAYIEPFDFGGLMLEGPTLCMMLAIICFLGGIDGVRNE